MSGRKTIALIAHDNKKPDLLAWVKHNREFLSDYDLCATGTTGKLIFEETGLEITRYQSGPLGGDAKIGSLIAEGKIDLMVFFFDPLESQPHDPDVKALLRLSAVWNVPSATNVATADLLITSPLFATYQPLKPDYSGYTNRLDSANT